MRLWKLSTPWFVPSMQPLELFFFQQVFNSMCLRSRDEASRFLPGLDSEEEQEVALVEFQRAMVRLFRIIRDDRKFDAMEYDANQNGNVGWYEFCAVWKERQIIIRLSIAERIFLTFEDTHRSLAGMLVSALVFLCIIVSTASFILSTLPELQDYCALASSPEYDPSCRPKPKDAFKAVDLVCTIFFTTEYAVRIVTSAFVRTELIDRDRGQLLEWITSDDIITLPTHLSRVTAWALNLSNLIDLLSIIPGYLTLAMGDGNGSPALSLIRLTRVIRAFRLGRRLESVIIIVRSLKKSIRALGVLLLNLFLGIIIFSSLMYFAEQGTWDGQLQAYLRWEGEQWNSTSEVWEPVYGRTPFESIPACFWWAIVTATTVGYGDAHTPRTAAGKVVAGLYMTWSLCVLALPIGVIGGNFSQVYVEYDQERQGDEETRVQEELMLQRSIAFGDPLHYSRQMVIEVWHDSGIGAPSTLDSDVIQSEFLGEVHFMLDLRVKESVRQTVRLALCPNLLKAKRKVRGHITFEYSWVPDAQRSSNTLLAGELQVTILRAEQLLGMDWTGRGEVNAYCVVMTHPESRDKDGSIPVAISRSKTVPHTTSPVWNMDIKSRFCWLKASADGNPRADLLSPPAVKPARSSVMALGDSGAATPDGVSSRGLNGGRRKDVEVDVYDDEGDENLRLGNRPMLLHVESSSLPLRRRESVAPPSPDKDATKTEKLLQLRPDAKVDVLRAVVPELQGEIEKLKAFVPRIHQEMAMVREDLNLIVEALRRRSAGAETQPGWEDRPLYWS